MKVVKQPVDLALYKRLFVHRTDVYAEQQANGAYLPFKEPINDWDLDEHLAGFRSIGTYVIEPRDQTVKSVVFDLDTYSLEAFNALVESVETLLWSVCNPGAEQFGSGPWGPPGKKEDAALDRAKRAMLAENSGGKGSHFWLFLSEPVTARRVRAWLGSEFWPVWMTHAIENPEWPALEVFPKQDEVDEGGFGNLVKLPGGVHAKSGNRSEFIPVTMWASTIENVVPLDVKLIPEVESPTAERNRPGSRRAAGQAGTGSTPGANTVQVRHSGAAHSDAGGVGGHPGVSLPAASRTPFPCIDKILDGEVDAGIRNDALFHLALYAFGHGFPEQLTDDWLQGINATFPSPVKPREVTQCVKSAYKGRKKGAPCGTDWLRSFCDREGCRGGWSVGADRNGALYRAKAGDTVSVEIVKVVIDPKTGRRITVKHDDANNQPTFVTD